MYYSGARHRLTQFLLQDSVCFFFDLLMKTKELVGFVLNSTGEEHLNLSHAHVWNKIYVADV